MENLNAEQIKSDLEHCKFGKDKPICEGCNYKPWIKPRCFGLLCSNALALINSQEQRIGELAEENDKLYRLVDDKIQENKRLTEERDTFRECAYNLQNYVNGIAEMQSQGYEPSAAKAAAEMEMWRVVALEKKKLTEENERLKDDNVIRLPIKVRQTVYVPWRYDGDQAVATVEVEEIKFYDSAMHYMFLIDMESDDECFNQSFGGWKIAQSIGKTVFLTKEEAEKSLKGE